MPQKTGHFITVDGIDGVGKTTQIQGLQRLLREFELDFITTRDPGSSEIGQRLRALLLESELTMHRRTEAMLFMASRCEMVESTIRPTLASGTSVISDRFLLANVVYQSVGDAQAGVSSELLWQIGDLANGGLRPDLTLLLDMPAERALRRIGRPTDRMESRGADYMESVRQAFLAELPRSSPVTAVIDADRPPEEVQAAIRAAVEDYFSGCS
ncbi:Thymidylate kinase [Stieleria maiorica]|uniref:Thymidylate kinase n=1 Tax=Stieleria maiorica TaxID=2795974 RepID=A0A5B9MFR5_9BACT|nr:dTMP kinase [Stieleria maiorica]QEF98860.1 Thymidylate kinase [Stieleria maiorica]